MLRQSSQVISKLLLVICCLLAGCSSVQQMSSSSPQATLNANAKQPPQKIALLLPLQGQYGASAQAIRNGFLAAYYYQKQRNPNAPTVTVVDTSTNDVRSAYSQAIAGGADFVVGPLTKPQVQELAGQSSLPTPTLALNSLDSGSSMPGNMFFFSLSPRDEAEQVANKAFADGYRHAIIIAPAGNWGQNIAGTFSNRWQSQGGTVVDTLAYTPKQDLASAIGNLLQVDKSVVSSQGFKKVVQEKIPLDQLHRQDFDVIFLVANPQQARLIRPLLKFYFAGNIPVYATSSIYSGTPSPNSDRDLNGIIFCDMPWVLDNPLPSDLGTIKSRIATLWPNSYINYSKLYAMGVDAYELSTNLYQLGNGSLAEATGNLYLGPQNQIYRRLQWAQIRNGVPTTI